MRKTILMLGLVLSALTASQAQPTVGSWINTGPVPFPINVSGQVNGMGRVSQIKFHSTNPAKIYAVSSSGGLFISNDTGRTWAPTPGTDVLPTTACSAVCLDYTDDNILYLCTGDQNYYGDWYGMFKSTDGGVTWNPANTGIGTAMAVDMAMDPANHMSLVAATDNGIWKTTNGGALWVQTLDSGQMRSMQPRPGGGHVLYAATGTSFFVSNDFGSTWSMITSGVTAPAGNEGMRIAVTPADTNIVYLGTTGGYGEIMKSVDGGSSFSLIYASDSQCIVCYDSTVTSGSQGYYNFNFAVNPTNANELILGSHCVWRSTDGGVTWSWRTQWWNQIHTDMHDLEFYPYNPSMKWNANDGGVWISTDSVATFWQPHCDGLSATEMYHSAQDPQVRQLTSAGTQDNGELYYDGAWKCNRGGDWGAKVNMDYQGKGTVYYDNGSRRDLAPLGGDYTYNKPFTGYSQFHIEFSPLLPTTAFLATDSIWSSRNMNAGSPSWAFLYTNGEDIMSLAMCKSDSNTIYAVTNNNHLLRCANALSATPTFTTLTTPAATNVAACVTTDRYNANVVYLSCGPSLYVSSNRGASWINITYLLPGLNIMKVIADDYSPLQRLFVCAGSYVYYKDNTTTVWTMITGLPTVANFTDMGVYNDSTSASVLRLSTYGRGAWECNIFNNYPPSGNFAGSKTYLCSGDTVVYHKNLYGSVSAFTWYFPGGTPSTSTADSPMVVYPTTGLYNAMLVASGTYGTDTILYSSYIDVAAGDTGTTTEGFEEAAFPPSPYWLQISQSGVYWQRADSIGGYGASLHSIVFDNFDNSTGGKHDRIVMPRIDLDFALSAYLKFDVAYAYYPGYTDTLMVEVSTDCERTFVPVYIKDSTILATAPDTTGYFIPSPTEWRTDSISLAPYLGQSIAIAFDNVGHYGQTIYIDNINLSVTHPPVSVESIAKVDTFSVFPNPATGVIQYRFDDNIVGQCSLTCSDVVGNLLLRFTTQGHNGSVDMSRFPPGIYLLSLEDATGQKHVARVVKE